MRLGRIACLLVAGCAGDIEPCSEDDHCKLGRVCHLGECIHQRPIPRAATSVNPVGGPCTYEGALECSYTGVVHCRNRIWEKVFDCPGADICYRIDQRDAVVCGDTWYSFVGATCSFEKAAACSFDRTSVNECNDGIWVQVIECATLRRCSVFEYEQETFIGCR